MPLKLANTAALFIFYDSTQCATLQSTEWTDEDETCSRGRDGIVGSAASMNADNLSQGLNNK